MTARYLWHCLWPQSSYSSSGSTTNSRTLHADGANSNLLRAFRSMDACNLTNMSCLAASTCCIVSRQFSLGRRNDDSSAVIRLLCLCGVEFGGRDVTTWEKNLALAVVSVYRCERTQSDYHTAVEEYSGGSHANQTILFFGHHIYHARTFCFLLFPPSLYETRSRGHSAGSSPPSPLRYAPSFDRETISALSFLVNSRPIMHVKIQYITPSVVSRSPLP